MSATRREMLEAAGGTGLLAIAAAAFAAPDARSSAPRPHPDLDLIQTCAEFDMLQRQFQHVCNVQFLHDDDASDAACLPIRDAMRPLLDRMERARATTLYGIQARAGSLALYDPALFVSMAAGRARNVNERLLFSLLRDLTPGIAAATFAKPEAFAERGQG